MTTTSSAEQSDASAPAGASTAPSWLPLAAVGVTLLLWASAFVAIRHLAGSFSAGSLSLGRLLVGSVCLGAVALSRGLPRPTRGQWVSIVTIGVLWFGIYNVALNAGEQDVDAGTAVMLIQVSPVLVALLAALFLHERFTAYLAIGLALAFGGVALIATASGDSGEDRSVLGVVLCLLAAVVYSVSLVLQKPLVARLPAIHVTWLACTVGAVVCLPFVGRLVDDTRDASASDVWWVVYLGVFPTAIAFTTFAYALRTMSASSLGVTTYLVPPITIVMGWLLLDETPPRMAYVGGVLALVGVAVARRKPRTVAVEPGPPR
ncbi:DMT family transporter [Nocardioides halotolerans]|uniref:DMT family transporter n=1 Tax=Nocardioides halotolerans TaxID=433660 RepID=UPI00042914CF|nr:DMT family transporter [Nocardioides halotolerans]